MTLCEKCIHREVCNIRNCHDEDDERALTYCADFKNKADFVEVVRCRECKHCEIVIDQFDNDWYFCKKTRNNAEVKPDDFCSYGERKSI